MENFKHDEENLSGTKNKGIHQDSFLNERKFLDSNFNQGNYKGNNGKGGKQKQENLQNNQDKSVQAIVMMNQEDAPYQFKLTIHKSQQSESTEQICELLNMKLFQYSAKAQYEQGNGKNQIQTSFQINDKQKAIDCFKFFDDHRKRKQNKSENIFPQETVNIMYILNNPLKIKYYEELFKPPNNQKHNKNNSQNNIKIPTSNHLLANQHQLNIQQIQLQQIQQYQQNPQIQQSVQIYPNILPQTFFVNPMVMPVNIVNSQLIPNPPSKIQNQKTKDQAKEEAKEKQKQEQLKKKKEQDEKRQKQEEEKKKQIEQLRQENKLKKLKEKTISEVTSCMHTFSNPEYEKIREELISRNQPISISDQKNDLQIKQKLNSADLVGDLDPNDIYSCKICYDIVLDPKECKNCNALFCSNCIKESTQCQECGMEAQNNFEGNINRIVRNQYENLIFKCPYDDQCSFQGPTFQAINHLKTCEMFQEKCPNKCGNWVAKRDIKIHAQYLCQLSEIICKNCETYDKPMKKKFHHNCFLILKKLVKKQSQKEQSQKQE